MFRLRVWFADPRNRIWVGPAVAVVAAVGLCVVAWALDIVIVERHVPTIDPESVDGLLTVLASSMLAVSTFSLSVLVAAFASAATSATPRATDLLMADDGTRRALGAFIGAFVFAVVAKTALSFDVYGTGGIFVVFVSTLGVLAYLVIRLVLWVRTMTTLGRMGDTLGRLEDVIRSALAAHAREPSFGARPGPEAEPEGFAVRRARPGYLRNIDVAALQRLGERLDATVHVRVRPGAFVDPTSVLCIVSGADLAGAPDEQERCRADAQSCFVVGTGRSYDQDPRYGLLVLSEVAQRALSPAVNDPGTAIAACSIASALLIDYAEATAAPPADTDGFPYDRVSVPELDEGEFITDTFPPIARDGAASIEVALRIQKLLAAVHANAPGRAMAATCRAVARQALERSTHELTLESERRVLEVEHRRLGLGS